MNTLPIVLKNPKILLIGAGNVGYQKAKVLSEHKIDFDVISLEVVDAFKALEVEVNHKNFEIGDMTSYSIVIDATGNPSVTNQLLIEKKHRNFLLNVVDQPKICDFYFAALLQYGALKVAVSSSGASPTIAQKVRDKIKRILPKNLKELTAQKSSQRAQKVINPKKTASEVNRILGKVYLIGCGTGDVELLTLKAYRLIQQADVVLIDHLISEEIREIIPKESMKIFVGKQKGAHSVKQEKINELLLDYASKGLEVARLKSGDPYIFGRGTEEALYLTEVGIRVEVVPGISSALAAPLSVGIAPTARGYSSGFTVVSAHLKGNRINLDWCELLKLKSHTTVVLMGVSRAKEIVEEALKIGVDENLQVAIISNATRKNQSVVTSRLKTLPQHAHDIPKPALLVFGDVVELSSKLPTYQTMIERLNEDIFHADNRANIQ